MNFRSFAGIPAGHTSKVWALALVLALGFLALPSAQAPLAEAQTPDDVIPGQWIIALDQRVDPTAIAPGLAQAAGGRVGHIYTAVLNGFSFHGSDQAAAALERNPNVRSVIPDRTVHVVDETLPAGVRRIDASHPSDANAHDSGYTGSGVTIAILDTGIDLDHPDLQGNIDTSLGKNCMGSGQPNDGNGHGTHVSGTAAAITGNGIGVVGIAADATLVPVKVLDDGGSGSWASVICGIDHVTANAGSIEVANMSLGGSGSASGCADGGLHEAICDSVGAGVVYTVAAGNSKSDASGFVPAAYPQVITVSAIADYDGEPGGSGGCLLFVGLGKQCDDDFAKFSNYGSIVDVTAPGVQVYSTDTGASYSYKSGTSMAAPHAAGVAALVRAADPSLSPADVEALLRSSGECPDGAQNAGSGNCSGQGSWDNDPDGITEPLINALWAVQAAGGDGDNPPTISITSPSNGDTVSGSVSITADASDDSAVTQVEFFVDGISVNSDSDGSDGWGTTWDSTKVDDGDYTVTATATDDADQTASDSITVTVDNVDEPPTASIVNPADGSTVGGTVTVQVDADDAEEPVGSLTVEVSIDGGDWTAANYNSSSGLYELDWDTSGLTDGSSHTIEAHATDSEAQTSAVDQVSVTVDNSTDSGGAAYTVSLDPHSINNGSTWTAEVTVSLSPADSNVTVTGHWDDGSNVSCTTDINGVCTVSTSRHKRISSVTYTVDLVGNGTNFDGETSITVSKP